MKAFLYHINNFNSLLSDQIEFRVQVFTSVFVFAWALIRKWHAISWTFGILTFFNRWICQWTKKSTINCSGSNDFFIIATKHWFCYIISVPLDSLIELNNGGLRSTQQYVQKVELEIVIIISFRMQSMIANQTKGQFGVYTFSWT